MIKISVIIPTYDRGGLLQKCLQSLFAQTYPQSKFEILVCDDGSTDETQKIVENLAKEYKNLRFLKQKRQGPATARNLGVKNAQGEIIAFIDDDCRPAHDWLENLNQAFEKHPETQGVEGKTIPDCLTSDLFTYQLLNDTGGKYWTCNIAYKKVALVKVGGFDEEFRFSHCEDIDLAYRILKMGKIIFTPEVIVIHPTKRVGLFSGLKKLSHLQDDFRLYKKHLNYLSRPFRIQSEIAVFFIIAFYHHAWYRIRLLKASLKHFWQNPLDWFKFLLKNLLEIAYITLIFPWAVLKVKKWVK